MEHVDEILLAEERRSATISLDDFKDERINFFECRTELPLIYQDLTPFHVHFLGFDRIIWVDDFCHLFDFVHVSLTVLFSVEDQHLLETFFAEAGKLNDTVIFHGRVVPDPFEGALLICSDFDTIIIISL